MSNHAPLKASQQRLRHVDRPSADFESVEPATLKLHWSCFRSFRGLTKEAETREAELRAMARGLKRLGIPVARHWNAATETLSFWLPNDKGS